MIKQLVAVLAAGAAVCGSASAAPITFTHASTGSGTIGGQSFDTTTFVITATADTDDIVAINADIDSLDHIDVSITIDGVGTFAILSDTRTFVNRVADVVGFSRSGVGGTDLLDGPFDAAFASYDLSASIGPITGNGELLQWMLEDVLTDMGVLAFDTASAQVTFAAAMPSGAEVPVPAAALLFVPALGGLIAARRKASA